MIAASSQRIYGHRSAVIRIRSAMRSCTGDALSADILVALSGACTTSWEDGDKDVAPTEGDTDVASADGDTVAPTPLAPNG